VTLVDAELGASHIWITDAAGRSARHLTDGRRWDRSPLWSPDGRSVVYASRRSGLEIYRKSIETGNSREVPLATGQAGIPYGWLATGQSLLFAHEGNRQLGIVRADGAAPPEIVSSRYAQQQIQVSADTQWLAYVSNETGVDEVYIRPAAPMDQTGSRVSINGGVDPKWRRDGKELFYLAPDGRLMAANVVSGSVIGTPHALFATRVTTARTFIGGRNQYDVAPDGQRFLMNIPVEPQSAPITVLVNWRETLRRR
jgi:Tol biopolymer transport system component